MTRYIAKRLVLLVVIILFVSVASFFLVHLLPGNPTATILGPDATPQNGWRHYVEVAHRLAFDEMNEQV